MDQIVLMPKKHKPLQLNRKNYQSWYSIPFCVPKSNDTSLIIPSFISCNTEENKYWIHFEVRVEIIGEDLFLYFTSIYKLRLLWYVKIIAVKIP